MKDHRDNPIRVRLPLSAWLWPRRDETGLTPAQVHKLREAARWRHTPPWWGHAKFALFVSIFLVGLAAFAVSLLTLLLNGVPFSRYSLVVYLLLLLMLWTGANNLRAEAKALREDPVGMGIHLERGLCPACAYPLRTVPAASDGCQVCPECGGAWKLPEAAGTDAG